MCTRYFVEPDNEEFREIISRAQRSQLARQFLKAGSPLKNGGEIRPTAVVPVAAPNRKGEIGVFPMKWGFTVPGHSLLVNARSETAGMRPTFRESWNTRRCAVPASWYYEWEHIPAPGGKEKIGDRFAIQPRDASLTWLCGLYRIEDGFPVFAVLTREPTQERRRIHNRMPRILPEKQSRRWLAKEEKPENMLRYAVTDLVAERAV